MLKKQVEGLQVVILDDAFQHRAIRCGYYILLTPYNQLYIDDHLLPWGRLRDLKTRALKANSIIVTQCPSNAQPIDFRVIDNRLHLPTYQHLFFSQVQYTNEQAVAGKRVLVLTGIAQPEYLMAHIRKLHPDACLMAFPDHHRFSRKDVKKILAKAQGCDAVITTEKDYHRLAETPLVEQLGNRLHTLPIQVVLRGDSNKDFDQDILNYVKQNL